MSSCRSGRRRRGGSQGRRGARSPSPLASGRGSSWGSPASATAPLRPSPTCTPPPPPRGRTGTRCTGAGSLASRPAYRPTGENAGPPTILCGTMRERRAYRGAPLFGTAAAGMVLGHWVSYRLAVPDPRLRHHVLIATGHGQFALVAKMAVALALAGAGVLVARHLGRRPPERARGVHAFGWVVAPPGCGPGPGVHGHGGHRADGLGPPGGRDVRPSPLPARARGAVPGGLHRRADPAGAVEGGAPAGPGRVRAPPLREFVAVDHLAFDPRVVATVTFRVKA